MTRFTRVLAACCLLAGLCLNPAAAEDGGAGVESGAAPVKSSDTWRHFENLVVTINNARDEVAALRKELQTTSDELEQERIRAELKRLAADIESLQSAWEMWATGGVDTALFTPKADQKFDWREELQSVFEPIVVELRRLTERPRKIERLRSELAFYQQRYTVAEAALKSIVDYKTKAPTHDLSSAFGDLEARWQKRRDDLHSRLQLTHFELEELLAPSRPAEEKTGEALQELLSGRLVNLLLALLAAALTYGGLWLLNRAYSQYMLRRGRKRPFLARAAHLAYILVSLILALFAAMAVLYVRGDWILLGLLLIVLVGAALTLQRSLPGYIKEAKVLLNIGPVREGERVIYNGLPWKVQALNMYSILVNPLLSGGRVLLPVSELSNLVSRCYDDSEPWFPSRVDDFVVLSDATYGKVLQQTPEQVRLRVAGAVKTYPAAAFLELQPQNLSLDGFAVITTFGVDYQHQAEATEAIRASLETYIRGRLQASPYGVYMKDILVDFNAAAASSLDFFLWAAFTGEAAEFYYRIRRLLQRLAVEACNNHGWVIPFNQLTVHMAGGEGPRPAGAGEG